MALSYNNSGSATANTGASTQHTVSVTINSGNDRKLLVAVSVNSTATVSSVTHAGNGMSLVDSQANGDLKIYIYHIQSPTTGTNNVVVTFSTTGVISVVGWLAVNNVNTTIGGTNKATGTSKSASVSVNTVQANSWLFGALSRVNSESKNATADNGETERWDLNSTNLFNGTGGHRTTTTTGAYSTGWSWASISNYAWAIIGVELKEAFTTATKTVTAKARIQFTRTKTVTAKTRITATKTKTLTAKANIRSPLSKTISAKGYIVSAGEWSDTWTVQVSITRTKTIQAKARIQRTETKTISAKGYIVQLRTKTIEAKANIKATQSKTISAKANLFKVVEKTISAKAELHMFVEYFFDTDDIDTGATTAYIDTVNDLARLSQGG